MHTQDEAKRARLDAASMSCAELVGHLREQLRPRSRPSAAVMPAQERGGAADEHGRAAPAAAGDDGSPRAQPTAAHAAERPEDSTPLQAFVAES